MALNSFNFIEYYMEYTKEGESPDDFWKWSAISTLGATLRDNVSLQWRMGAIYPNSFIILFSDSGICRKAAPCKFAGKLIQLVGNTKFINGRASMQAVVKELAALNTTNENGKQLSGASGMLFSEELSSFAVADPATVPLLTDLYDFHETWSNTLISNGAVKLRKVCLSLLAASNSDLFKSVYTEQAVKGGLLGRTLIVAADKPRHRRSLLDLSEQQAPEADVAGFEPLVKHLQKLSKYKGKMQLTPDATKLEKEWYYSLTDDYVRDKMGFGARLETHVIKTAMALGAARENFEEPISKGIIQEAIQLITGLRKNYKFITVMSGTASIAQQAAMVVKYALEEKDYKISREKLIQRTLGNLDVEVLDKIVALMVQGGFMVEQSVGMKPGYKLTEKAVHVFLLGQEVTA